MDSLLLDLRDALRGFRRTPGFVGAAVLTLALGIGATTAVFSVLHGVLLRDLPYPDSGRLATVDWYVSPMNLRDVLAASKSYTAAGGAATQPFDWISGTEPQQVPAALVTGGYFDALGVAPERGRTLEAADDRPGAPRSVVITHEFWQTKLGGDPEVVGRSLRLSGNAWTVVGVMPPGFRLPRFGDADLFAPVEVGLPAAAQARGVNFLRTVLRLAPGVTLERAQQELTGVGKQLARDYPEENAERSWTLVPLLERMVGRVRTVLWVLFGAVTLVLLIACANFAHLLLTRGAARTHELAVRSSMGAGRGRLVRHLLTESVLISIAGGVLGVLIAQWAVDLLLALQPDNLPRLAEIRVDAGVLVFALVLSMLTGMVAGLVPALQATRGAEAEALKRGSTGVMRAGANRLLGSLAVTQIALALVLLAGAGLLLDTFWRLRSVEPGFDPHHVLSLRTELPEAKYPTLADQTRWRARVLDELRAVPGARAAMVSEVPLSGDALNHNVVVEGAPPVEPGHEPELFSRSVAGDYFDVMGIRILRGRALRDDDDAAAPRVGVINEAMAREYFPGVDPLGRRVRWARHEGPLVWITIVGVCADVKHFGLAESEYSAIYTPYAQFDQDWKRWTSVVVRGPGDPSSLVRPVSRALAAVDPEIPLTQLRSLDEVVAASLATQRFYLVLIGAFAAIALALATIGVFGVTAYAAERRTRELGLRMALGATGRDVYWLLLRRGLVMVGLGVGIGIAGALSLTGFLRSMLFGVQPGDPATLVAVAVLLGTVALVACTIPAWRAMKLEPLAALRTE